MYQLQLGMVSGHPELGKRFNPMKVIGLLVFPETPGIFLSACTGMLVPHNGSKVYSKYHAAIHELQAPFF